MTAYVIGLLSNLQFGPDIVTYLQRIDDSLAPFEGEFLVHGARPKVKEGSVDGDCIIISFPSSAKARAWYTSDAYVDLIPLRARHAQSVVMLLEGVEPGYQASSFLAKLGVTG